MVAEQTSTITVVLADQDRLARDGLRKELERGRRFEVVSEMDYAIARVAQRLQPDLILLDPRTGHGSLDTALLAELRRAVPSGVIAMFTRVDKPAAILEAVRAGASMYYRKSREHDPQALLNALVFAVQERGKWLMIGSELASQLATAPVPVPDVTAAQAGLPALTERQREVLALLVEGMTEKEIARCLTISEPTVEDHIHRLREKLGAHSRDRLCFLTGKFGLVEG